MSACCNVCGRKITGDADLWSVSFQCKLKQGEQFRCCDKCKGEVIKAVGKIIDKHNRDKIFVWWKL